MYMFRYNAVPIAVFLASTLPYFRSYFFLSILSKASHPFPKLGRKLEYIVDEIMERSGNIAPGTRGGCLTTRERDINE